MREKWADKAYPHGRDSEEKERAKAFFEGGPIAELKNLPEREKTEQERAYHEIMMTHMNAYFRALDLPSVQISEDRIHVVEPQAFIESSDFDFEPEGYASNGHAYIPGDKASLDYVQAMVHETMHLASHLSIDVDVDKKKFGTRKTGMDFRPEGGERGVKLFTGINEAMTEILSHNVKTDALDEWGFNEEEKARARSELSYLPQIMVLERLIEEFAESPEEREKVFKALAHDYMRGTYTVIRNWDQRRKGLTKILGAMTIGRASAVETAKELGFEEVVKRIDSVIYPKGQDG